MEYILIILVCFLSSTAGAICGVGGGVIIKPVLDATGVMTVTTVSFLSGCTVLSMSVVSFYKNLKGKRDFIFDRRFAAVLVLGSVAGGLLGKEIYHRIISHLSDSSQVGAIQAVILAIVTVGTLIYTTSKERISTKRVQNKGVIIGIGVALGMLSSFLGIGGGPINLVVLFYFFSMETKQAALYSIYIIMFSQMSSLVLTVTKKNIPAFEWKTLLLMAVCGMLGGLAGSRINKRIESKTVDKLFMGIMGVIICISIYNIFCYI